MRRDGKMSQSELRHHKKFIRECQEDAKNERYQLVMASGEVLDFVTGAEVDEYVKSIDYNYSLITTVRIIHAIICLGTGSEYIPCQAICVPCRSCAQKM